MKVWSGLEWSGVVWCGIVVTPATLISISSLGKEASPPRPASYFGHCEDSAAATFESVDAHERNFCRCSHD